MVIKIALGLIGGFIAFLVIGNMLYDPTDPKMRDRMGIDECWKEQGRKSATPGEARFMAGGCEMLEDRFRKTHGTNP